MAYCSQTASEKNIQTNLIWSSWTLSDALSRTLKKHQLNFHTTKTDDHMLKDLDQTECWDNWTFFIPTVYKMQDLIIHSFLSVWVKTLKGLQNLHFRLANRVFFIDLIYFKLFTHFKSSRTLLLKLSGWNLYSFI